MIDFACKRFNLDEIFKCGLGLTKADSKVMNFLVKNSIESFTTEEISEQLGLNLTTIQRAVKKLHEKEIIERKQENLSGGGYKFRYEIRSKKEIRTVMMNIVHNWVKTVEKELGGW